MSELLVDIHVPLPKDLVQSAVYVDAGLAKFGRTHLAVALQERGMSTTFSRGRDAYDLEAGSVQILDPVIENDRETGYKVTVTQKEIALGGIRAIRNIAKAIGGDVPELNHPDVRMAARDKMISNQLLAPLGLGKAHAAWPQAESFTEIIAALPTADVVVKPRAGQRSQNVYVGSKQAICELEAEGLFSSGEWIVEERLQYADRTVVKGLDDDNQAKITYANRYRLPKELRAYVFGRDAGHNPITSYVLRVAAQADDTYLLNDQWVYLDPESVPDEVHENTASVTAAFENYAGTSEVHLAIDHVETASGQTKPMEVNASEPQLIRVSEHAAISSLQTGMLADQLVRIAQAGGVKKKAKV